MNKKIDKNISPFCKQLESETFRQDIYQSFIKLFIDFNLSDPRFFSYKQEQSKNIFPLQFIGFDNGTIKVLRINIPAMVSIQFPIFFS